MINIPFKQLQFSRCGRMIPSDCTASMAQQGIKDNDVIHAATYKDGYDDQKTLIPITIKMALAARARGDTNDDGIYLLQDGM